MITAKYGRQPDVLNQNHKQLIALLDHHLVQMIKNAEMISDLSLAETHALEDFERNSLVDPLQEMCMFIEKDGRVNIL